MRFSNALIRTSRDAPVDAAGASHVLLTRAGYIRKVGAEIYDELPLGVQSEGFIWGEMSRTGAQEALMPVLLHAAYFQQLGRFQHSGWVRLRQSLQDGGAR